MKKAVFIDRDGLINSDVGHYYIYKPEDFVLNTGVIEALKVLYDAGFILIVISNQGGVDKGKYTCEDVELVHMKMQKLFSEAGVILTEIYYCPHHNDVQKCLCRKPQNLNIEKAISRFNIRREESWMIGDSQRDIEAGKASGLKTIKIQSNENLMPYISKIIKE